jgi:integrase
MIARWSQRFNPLFFLRKPKNYLGGKQPVYMPITIDGARTDLSTQRKCDPDRWNSRAGRGNGTKEEFRVLNAYLKEIADVCGIHKNLTFHIARHTFATTVTLSNGVPIESVSKMLGHKICVLPSTMRKSWISR